MLGSKGREEKYFKMRNEKTNKTQHLLLILRVDINKSHQKFILEIKFEE